VLRTGFVVLIALNLLAWAHADLKFSGWSQLRYNDWDDGLTGESFDIRRFRLTLDGDLGSRTNFRFQVDLAGIDDTSANKAFEYKDWYLGHQFSDELRGTIGYTSVTFGLETPTSNSRLLPFERSQASNRLFPGERDTGVYLHWTPGGSWPQLSAGFSDGMTRWQDLAKNGDEDTDSEALYFRAQWPLARKGVIGASYRTADRTHRASGVLTDYDDDLLGFHARYVFPEHWAVVGEYYDGEDLGVDVNGWYGQAEYAFSGTPVTAFYRHDVYDFGGSDDYDRDVAGAVWFRTKTDQFTVQLEDYEDGKGGSFTNWGLQYQVSY